ncbi:LuxR C-terminal-related transcriptional regulator [Undibacterium cyanobacteriorum]|uniref:LuxR C-terminal-related transcriptional regulator n=1 Tax=Undibacterium cyanobacteriorum TaxID=3073561 RepID=A0ABY9RQC5_9BURK|nr:LuxR C-terminal-related transcriptional regulator [Undibacterium sp. 20NA77.5]WMW82181.1 LuxR C-terminal-related transcriptional regulator [Undibacterium sp. 20NA77.5]
MSTNIDFAAIFELAPVGMCVSQNRRMITCNEAMVQMFGHSKERLVGESFLLLYPSSDEFERTGARLVPILNATGYYSDERIMKRANQELFWCHVSGRALDPKDPHAGGIWTFEDLSAKRSVSPEMTAREREIAALIVDGKTSKLIARQLDLSPRTVEMYRAKLMKKLQANSSSELINKLLRISA